MFLMTDPYTSDAPMRCFFCRNLFFMEKQIPGRYFYFYFC